MTNILLGIIIGQLLTIDIYLVLIYTRMEHYRD